MPILNPELCYITPHVKNVLLNNEGMEFDLNEFLIKFCKQICQLIDDSNPQTYTDLLNKFKDEHFHPTTYSRHDVLCNNARVLSQLFENNELSHDWKSGHAIQIHIDANACTEGLLSRFKIAIITSETPKNLDEILSKIRMDIVEQIARKFLKKTLEGNNIHTFNQFYTVAHRKNFGVLPIHEDDVHTGDLLPEEIEPKLVKGFDRHYHMWNILFSIENQLREALHKLNYFGPNHDELGYFMEEYNRCIHFIKSVIPSDLTLSDLSVLNDNDSIKDINWVVIRKQLYQLLKNKGYIELTQNEAYLTDFLFNEETDANLFEKHLIALSHVNSGCILSLFKKPLHLIKCLDFFQHWSIERKQALVNVYINSCPNRYEAMLDLHNELQNEHMNLIPLLYDFSFFKTINADGKTPIAQAILQGASTKLHLYFNKFVHLPVDELNFIMREGISPSKHSSANPLFYLAKKYPFALEILLQYLGSPAHAALIRNILFSPDNHLMNFIIESKPALLHSFWACVDGAFTSDEFHALLCAEKGVIFSSLLQLNCPVETAFLLPLIEKKLTNSQLQDLFWNTRVHDWNILQLVLFYAPDKALPLLNLIIRIKMNKAKLKSLVVSLNSYKVNSIVKALTDCHAIISILHEILQHLSKKDVLSLLNKKFKHNNDYLNNLMMVALKEYPAYATTLWNSACQKLSAVELQPILSHINEQGENIFSMALQYNPELAEQIFFHAMDAKLPNTLETLQAKHGRTIELAIKHCSAWAPALIDHMIKSGQTECLLRTRDSEDSTLLLLAIMHAPGAVSPILELIFKTTASPDTFIDYLLSINKQGFNCLAIAMKHNQIIPIMKFIKLYIPENKMHLLNTSILTCANLSSIFQNSSEDIASLNIPSLKIEPAELIGFLEKTYDGNRTILMLAMKSSEFLFLELIELVRKNLTSDQISNVLQLTNKAGFNLFLLAIESASIIIMNAVFMLVDKLSSLEMKTSYLSSLTFKGDNSLMLAARSASAPVIEWIFKKMPTDITQALVRQQVNCQTALTIMIEKSPDKVSKFFAYFTHLPRPQRYAVITHLNKAGENILMLAIRKSPSCIDAIIKEFNFTLTLDEKRVLYSQTTEGKTISDYLEQYCPQLKDQVLSCISDSLTTRKRMLITPSVSESGIGLFSSVTDEITQPDSKCSRVNDALFISF